MRRAVSGWVSHFAARSASTGDWLATHFWLILCLVGLAGIPGAHLATNRTFGPLPPPIDSTSPRMSSAIALVTDEKGVPIASADVVALALVGDHGEARLAGRGTTGPDGRVRFEHLPEAEHWFVARKTGRSRAAVNVVIAGTEPREVVLVTGPEHVLEVDVHDDQGIAILNAEIEVRAAGPLPVGARTDITGHAHVTGLSPGPWSVTARATGFEELAQPAVKEGTPLSLVLRRLGSLLVHVVDEAGNPVQDARVQITGTALWPPREGRTGPKGMVKMAGLLAGAYSLRATSGEKVSPIEVAVPLERGQDEEITLTLGPGRRVVVRVTNGPEDDAAAIAGARVVLVEGGLAPFPLEGVTDGSGRVLLGPIAVGPASASATADGFVDTSPVNVADTGETRIALVRAGVLFGRIVDSKGRGIDGATLEVVGTDVLGMPIDDEPIRASFRRAHFDAVLPGPTQLVPAGELGVVPGPVPPIPHALPGGGSASVTPSLRDAASAIPIEPWVSRGDGAFRITPVTPGRVRVIARHPQWVEGESEIVTLPPGGERETTVVLRAGGALEGRVVDAANRPVSGAHVVVAAMRGSLERTTGTGTDGSFAFASLPDAVSVSVFKTDDAIHPAVRRSLDIPEGTKKEITLVLPAERDPMKVSVRDDRSYPVTMAQVSVASLDPSSPLRATGFTDDHGEAIVDGVVGLAIRIDVTSPRSAPKQIVLDSAPRTLDVVLEAGQSVTGEVTGERSGPLANATIIAYTDAGVRRTLTDAKGEFTIGDLAPGDARIRIEADGFARTDVKTKLEKSTPVKKLGRIDLPPEAIVEGRVVDGKGDGVRGARVAIGSVPTYLAVGATQGDIATTDSKGAFRLRGLSEGNLAVEAYAPDVGRSKTIAQARAGQTTRDVVITLKPDDEKGSGGTNAAASVAITLAETGEPREVFVASVAENSEAERAGLRTGDVLLEVDGAPVKTIADARTRLGGPKGDDVVLKLRREGRTIATRVVREQVRR